MIVFFIFILKKNVQVRNWTDGAFIEEILKSNIAIELRGITLIRLFFIQQEISKGTNGFKGKEAEK